MVSSPLSSASQQTSQRVLAVILVVVVLGGLVVGPAAVSAQSANGTNTTNATDTANATNSTTGANQTMPADASNQRNQSSSNAGGPNRGITGGGVGESGNNARNSTNSSDGGNTSRLSGQSGTATGGNQTALTNWVNDLAEMNESQAQQAVEDNPQKADQLANALEQTGVENPNETVQQRPRQAARQVASVLAAGNSSANGSAGNNSSAGGQVQLRQCSGGGFIDSAMCKASNFLFGWIVGGVVDFVQGVITDIVNLIVGTPVPEHDGSPAFFQQPTNQPWQGVYNSWLTFAMPLGIVMWMLMMMGILFSQVYISSSSSELKRRELKNRSWKVLLGILGSFAIGSAILHISNAITLAVAPTGEQIASNLAVFTGNLGAAGAAGLLMWFFGGLLFLFILLLVLAQKAVVFVMIWSLPVLLPLAAFNVGPVKLLSKPARGMIDMFIPFVFLTLPMALVLRVGYVVVNSLNQGAIAQTGMYLSGANTALILGFWIVAAVSPLFVFSEAGRIKGMAAGMLGASIATSNVKEKVQNAKEHVTSNGQLNEKTNINEGKNEGEYGGALPNWNDSPSMLEAGTSQDSKRAEAESSSFPEIGGGPQSPSPSTPGSTTPETGEAGDPELPPGQPLPGGDSNSASAGTGTATSTSGRQTGSTRDNPVVSRGDVTQVRTPRDLPDDTKYQVGQVKDNGEFQPVRRNEGLSREAILTGRYDRINERTEKYKDEKLLLRSKDDESFYDMDSVTHREQSYEQMSKDTSEDVLNS